ncbi:MAG: carboxypeptidase M32 [Actinomycetota bacterium]
MKAWDDFALRMKQLGDLGHMGSLMGWDQQVMMPPKGVEARASAMGTLAAIRHERVVDPVLGDLIETLTEAELDDERKMMVKRVKRNRDISVKLPARLVEELAETTGKAHPVWQKARDTDDFSIFEPHLDNIFKLLAERAEHLGYENEVYDAHLDLFEMGATTADVEPVFKRVADEIHPLLDKVFKTDTADWNLPETPNHLDDLLTYSRDLLARFGYDLDAGRLDLAAHPFCSGLDSGDVRVTTRLNAKNPKECILATVHEMGHGFYEQGIPDKWKGTSIGKYVSLGVHESQSRLWENHVARSRSFWEGEAPRASKAIAPWAGLGADDYYRAANRVDPESYIRVEADELTYPLHVILRFELEIAISRGELKAGDLPSAWNEAMQKHLGITPPGDGKGVLQDVHWAAGLFGYFPTYLLGSIYSAALFAKATQDLGGETAVDASLAAGRFEGLLGWLRDKVHSQGALHDPSDLMAAATGLAAGSQIDTAPYIDYLKKKFGDLYGI